MTLMLQSPSFALHWDPHPGTFCLESPGRSLSAFLGVEVVRRGHGVKLTTEEIAPTSAECHSLRDRHGAAEELEIHYQESEGLLFTARVRLYASRPFALVHLGVINKGPDVVHLLRFFLQTLPEQLKPTAAPLGFYRTGWQSWSDAGFVPAESRDYAPILPMKKLAGPMMHNAQTPWPGKIGRFWSESVGAVVTSNEALIAGGASLGEQFVQVGADLRPDAFKLVIQSQGDDVPVAVGEARASEWFYLEWAPFPNTDPLAQYAYTVARQMEIPLIRPAPTGWSSWYIFWAKVAESDVIDNLATAALLADELPLQVIQLDQGFERTWGDWTERNERFPHSLGWLAERIRGSKCSPGLWLAPLTAHPRSKIATEHPDWLLRDAHGRHVSAGLIGYNFLARALDPTHPGVEAYLHKLIRTVVEEWGYAYLKLDFLYAGALPGRRYNSTLTRAQAYRHALTIIRKAAGDKVFLVGCGAPLGPSIGLVDAMRIGPDTAPAWEPDVPRIFSFLKRDPGLPSLRNSLSNVITRAWMHGRWWINDPDNLMVRTKRTALSEDEIITQVSLLGLTSGLIVFSDDLSQLPSEQRAVAAVLLPPLVEGGDALDLLQRDMPDRVVSPVACVLGNWQLVGLFNWGTSPRERELPRNLPGLNLQRDYHIVDFWNHRYLHLKRGEPLPKFTLPPHGCVLLSVRPVQEGPHLVATTFHISQGGEITAFENGNGSVSISLALGRVAEGEVWLALPAPPKSASFEGNALPEEAFRAVAHGIWAVRFQIAREGTLHVCYGNHE